jgi:ATP-dependent helicase HrpA
MRLVAQLVTENAVLQKRLAALNKAFPEAVADVHAQIAALLPADFLLAFDWERLAHFPRYLKAAVLRLDKLREDPARDAKAMTEWKTLAQAWAREAAARRRAGLADPELDAFRWLLEELRVGLYAQALKTPVPVSVKRLQKIWEGRSR